MEEPNNSDQVSPRATRQKTAGVCSDLLSYQRVLQVAIIVGLGGIFSYGFQLSMISLTSQFIKAFINDTWLERYQVPVGEQTLTFLWTLIICSWTIGGLAGTLLSRYFLANYSRKRGFMFCGLLALITAMITGTSAMAKSFEMILLGRFLYGLNANFCLCIQSQYLTEISPRHLRGMFTTISGMFVKLGSFLGPVAALPELLGTESLWPLLLMSNGTLGVIILVTIPFFPESPAHLLIQNGDFEGGLKAFKEFWGDRYQEGEANNMLEEQIAIRNGKVMTILEFLRDRSLRLQIYLLIAIASALALSGSNVVYYYLFDILCATGLDEQIIPYVAISIGSCELISSFVCILVIEHLGRRKLLVWGYGLMMLTLILLTATMSLQDQASWLPYGSVVLICFFLLLFRGGPASVTITVTAELFPQSSRPPALTLLMFIGLTEGFLVGMLFPYLQQYANNFCFLFFAGCIAFLWVFLYRLLPETMGKTFTEIQQEFNRLRLRKEDPAAVSLELTKDIWNYKGRQHASKRHFQEAESRKKLFSA